MRAARFRGLIIRILGPRWELKIIKGLMSLLVKSGPRDLNRLNEPKIERKNQRWTKSPGAAAASINKATNGECITLVKKVSENQSPIKHRSHQVKKTKCADSWIPWERSAFTLHARTFRGLWKYKKIHAGKGALDGFVFESSLQILHVSTRLYRF